MSIKLTVKQYLRTASDGCYLLAKWIVLVYIAAVTILSILGVFFRTAGSALSWNEELMRWLLIGTGYIGASVALKIRSHIGIEFFLLKMKPPIRKAAIIFGYLFIVVFLVIIFWYSLQAALMARYQLGAIIRIPMLWVKLNIPIGCILMLVHMTYFLVGIWDEKENLREYMISGGQSEGGVE